MCEKKIKCDFEKNQMWKNPNVIKFCNLEHKFQNSQAID